MKVLILFFPFVLCGANFAWADCPNFASKFNCLPVASSKNYILSIQQISPDSNKYTLSKLYDDQTSELTSFVADGSEIQVLSGPNHAIFQTASCDNSSLALTTREIESSGEMTTTGTVTENYHYTENGKMLQVDLSGSFASNGGHPVIPPVQSTLCVSILEH